MDEVWTYVTSQFIAFYRSMPEISPTQLLVNLENRRSHYAAVSDTFRVEYDRVKYQFNGREFRRLLEDLAIEAVSRYGVSLMQQVFPGDKLMIEPWIHHISAGYFHFWGEKHRNISSYRAVGHNIKRLNEKYGLNFFPAQPLRKHDDTVDGYVVHAVSMGWFYRKQALTPVFALTEDPYDDTLERILQYQAVLAYYQDPRRSPLPVSQRIRKLCPGVLFQFNRSTSCLQVAVFSPAQVIQTGPDSVSISCHHDPEQFVLS